MVTREDLRHNKRVPGSLEVTIQDINTDPKSPRDVELEVTDTNDKKLEIIIWKKHDVSGDLTVGETYEITGGRAKRYDTSSGTRVVVSSNRDFSVERMDTAAEPTELLVIGDTHVGYRHRKAADKPSWEKTVDNRATFSQSLARARDLKVDGVIHAGDVFDHNPNTGDREHVLQETKKTVSSGVPVYFVRGNHDNQAGNRTLSQSPAVHIGGKRVSIGPEPVQVGGLDYCAGEVSSLPLEGDLETFLNPSILVIHDTPYPAVDEAGVPIYRNDTNKLDLSGFLGSAGDWLDLIVAGHMHVGIEGSIEGSNIPLLVTGPTGPISSYIEENQPSTWLLTYSDGRMDVERQPL